MGPVKGQGKSGLSEKLGDRKGSVGSHVVTPLDMFAKKNVILVHWGPFTNYVYKRRGVGGQKNQLFVNFYTIENVKGEVVKKRQTS